MKKLLVTAAVIAALAPAIASAQDRGGREGGYRRDGGGQGAGRSEGGDRGQPSFRGRGVIADPPAQAAPQAPAQAAPQADRRFDGGGRGQDFQSGDRTDRNRGGGQGDRRDFGGRGDDGRRSDNRGGDNRGGRNFDGRGYDNRRYDNGRGSDNRGYDRGGARRDGGRFAYRGRSFDRFRAQPYRWPGGYRSSFAWRPRQILPSAFLLRDYFIDNYYDFGFGRPPYGYEWVRVGDDALLVNIYTGEIVEVVPGVFYW